MFTRPSNSFGSPRVTEIAGPVSATVFPVEVSDPWHPPSQPEEQADSPQQQIPDDPFKRLLAATEFDCEEVKAESVRLSVERTKQNEMIREFLQRRAGQRREAMIEAHESLKVQCVKSETKLDQLKGKLALADREQAEAENTVRRCAAVTQSLTDERRAMNRWTSRAEIAAHEKKMASAVAKLRAAEKAQAEARQKRNTIALEEFKQPIEEFERLKVQEARLRGQLSGRAFVDPEFGISRTA